ncbi:hypothetical protein Tco_1381079, partial [Tanacetum coccineum]
QKLGTVLHLMQRWVDPPEPMILPEIPPEPVGKLTRGGREGLGEEMAIEEANAAGGGGMGIWVTIKHVFLIKPSKECCGYAERRLCRFKMEIKDMLGGWNVQTKARLQFQNEFREVKMAENKR